jgi:hypothetical protein
VEAFFRFGDMPTSIPLYDLRRTPAYAFAVENVRFVIKEALNIHKDKSLNTNISRQKSLELFLRLCYEEPAPILNYRLSGELHRVRLVGKGKNARYEWAEDYFRDCQPMGTNR